MKMHKINQMIFPNINRQKQKRIAAVSILVILVLAIGSRQVTSGSFLKSVDSADSAIAAEFDVTITVPEELLSEQGDDVLVCHFISDMDVKGFSFQVSNNGETDIICRPYISNGITYKIYFDGQECIEFAAAANETVVFWLILEPDGISTDITNAELFIDIQQM